MPTVSVVIPAYNSGRYLADTVDSVVRQTMTDWELTIVDDGSTDKTPELIDELVGSDSRIRSVRQQNGGIANARNRGYAETNGASKYVAFLDHDDIWKPFLLAELTGILDKNASLSGAYGVTGVIDEKGRPEEDSTFERHQRNRRGIRDGRLVEWPAGEPTSFCVLAFWNYIITAGQVVVRRSALDRAGLFDPRVVPADDWDMWLRLTAISDFGMLDKVVMGWRRHGGNTSSQKTRMDRATRAVRRKMMKLGELTVEQRRTVKRGYWLDCAVKLGFALGCLSHRNYGEAIRQTSRALFGFARYLVSTH